MDPDTIARIRMTVLRLSRPGSSGPIDALHWLTAAQAQEFRYARWSLAERTRRPDAGEVDRAFAEGSILRTHILRPTWHFVTADDLRWLMRLSGPRVNAVNARRYAELGIDAGTRARSNDAIAAAVAGTQLTRRDLATVLERRRIATEGQRIAYLVMAAELDAVICSGPMAGKQHTYAAFDERVPSGPVIEGDEALTELATRYFTARGPATVRDFAWWSGLAMSRARAGLEMARPKLEHVLVDDRTYWFAEGTSPQRSGSPDVTLVQCYDEVIISYSQSRDVLQAPSVHFPVPRTVEGFAHVILCDGRLLGHWRLARARVGTSIETRPARRLTDREDAALSAALDRCTRFFST